MSHSAHSMSTPPRPVSRPIRGVPTSRAYWELKAEQMMNRIFDPEAPIDLTVDGEPEARRPAALPAGNGRGSGASRPTRTAPPASRREQPVLLLGALAGVCMVSAVSSILYLTHSNQLQQSLRQERNLLLVERLRSLGPANPAPVPGPEPSTPVLPDAAALPAGTAAPGSAASQLPPPPAEEPWIEELSSLPPTDPAPARVLRVPVSPSLAAAAPAASRAPAPRAATGPVPQLVGVVGTPGKAGSAIFLLNGTSMSVGTGEMVGSSGWRLRAAEGETALLEKNGDVRQVSISNGF